MRSVFWWGLSIGLLASMALLGCDDSSGGGDASAEDDGPGADMAAALDGDAPDPDMGPGADMAPACADGETRPCAVEGVDDCAGTQACVEGVFGPCETTVEVCDGEDDDCDGVVDEVDGAGDRCAVGVGACAVDGALACGPDGALACDAEPGEPRVEACGTAIDEDCDGELDEAGCTCAADRNCAEGELCIDRACVEGNCREDADCGDGELCMDNACRPGECRDDAQCPPGHTCVDFVCEGPPPTCAAPQRIERVGVVTGSTVGAASDVGASCGEGAGSAERAFLLDLGVEGPICLGTTGAGYDTVLHVQTRCGDPATEIACNDDVLPDNLRSQVQLESGAEPVFVMVDGHGSNASGSFVLDVIAGECPCIGDANCAAGEICRAGVCGALVCGDGVRERAEECDDGGVEPGDGCDGGCLLEAGFACLPRPESAPDRCLPEGDEICDDGVDNDLNGVTDCVDPDCSDFPGCPCPQDDEFEAESPGPRLPPGRTEGLVQCDVQDYYNFMLCAGGTTRVTVEFDHDEGNIDVWLGNANLQQGVAQSTSSDDDEVVEYTNDTGAPARMDIQISAGGRRSNRYAIDIEIFDCAPGAELCTDGDDDDGDGLVDCLDPDCLEHPNCGPPNLACQNARPLPGPGIYIGDTTGGPRADRENDPDCLDSLVPAVGAEVAYAFDPPAAGTYCLSTLGSTFNTVLYVRQDVCDDRRREIACNNNNDAIAGLQRSAIELDVDGESTYFIFVDGFFYNQEGPYQLRVTEGECRLPVEICDNRVNDDVDQATDCEDPDCFGSPACSD